MVQGIAVVRAAAGAAADGGADHGGHGLDLSAGHVAVFCQMVYNRIDAHQAEVHLHDINDGTPAGHGGADAEAHDGILCQRGVDDPVGAVLMIQVAGDAVGAAQDTDILAHHNDLFVPAEFLVQGQADCLHVCHFLRFHDYSSFPSQRSA